MGIFLKGFDYLIYLIIFSAIKCQDFGALHSFIYLKFNKQANFIWKTLLLELILFNFQKYYWFELVLGFENEHAKSKKTKVY